MNENVYFYTETESKRKIKVPSTIRGYHIDKNIGKGAFASVVKVTETNTQKEYAAKIIPLGNIDDTSKNRIKLMVENEVIILQSVSHANIIQLYEITELTTKDDEFIVLIEEYCPKGNLLDYINAYGFTDQLQKRRISRGVTDAIRFLHSKGIAHCDIKPENVLLDADCNPKLCDFNLSKIVENASDSRRGGSEAYAAPELFKFDKVDFLKADIWSLGIMIFGIEELTYPYEEVEDARRGILRFGDASMKLQSFAKRCLLVDPKRRSTAEQLLSDPYLTFDSENDNDDADMISRKAKETVKRMSSCPPTADERYFQRESNDSSEENNHDRNENEGDILDDDLFESIYGYRRSQCHFNSPINSDDDEYVTKIVYKKSESQDSDGYNGQIDNTSSFQRGPSSCVSFGVNEKVDKQCLPSFTSSCSELFKAAETEDQDDEDKKNYSLQQDNSYECNDNDSEEFGSFSLTLQLGFDFEFQERTECDMDNDFDDDKGNDLDDVDDYEIERYEDKICDRLVKIKYEKRSRQKKKKVHSKKKEKNDRKSDQEDLE